MDNLSEGQFEEVQGEQEYLPEYICIKKQVPEEDEVCESETASCSEAKTMTGNILERIITDPRCRRPPCLGKWPTYPPKSESDFQDNFHQYRAAQQSTCLDQMCSLRITSEPNIYRQPAIVGTIGPASTYVSKILDLLQAGMNIARVSMAHVDSCSIREPIQNIIEGSNQFKTIKDYEIPVPIMMDLKGPEIRTGIIDPGRKNKNPGEILLKENSFVRLTSDEIFQERCTEKIIYVNYPKLTCHAVEGIMVYISGGQIKLKVDSIEKPAVVCLVVVGGILKNNQKVYIPSIPTLLPAISNYDQECLELAVEMDVDIIVVPKARNRETIKEVRKRLNCIKKDNNIMIFAKISNFEGLENIDEILQVADGVVIQKNDLCLDISPEKTFIAQKEIIGKCNKVGKPVFCTAQLSASPSDSLKRIEINDIGGAIVDGADGIILIRETAIGDKSVEAVTQLSNIMREAEAATMQKPFHFDLVDRQPVSMEPIKAIALAAVQVANKIHASAILTVTTTGRTAQLLSWFRPRAPVIAISRVGKTARQLNLWRAVIPLHFSAPVLSDWFHDVKARFEYGISYGQDCGIIASGDLLVLVSGYRKSSGFTNCIRIVFASLEKNRFGESVSNYYENSKNEPFNI